MTAPTPGRRLHAALLAHGFGIADWDGLSEGLREGMEAAAREYDEAGTGMTEQASAFAGTRLYHAWRRASLADVPRPDWGDPAFAGSGWAMVARELGIVDDITSEIEGRDRLDALAAEVAALRRDRGMDLAAMAEVGDRLAILESSKENVGSWLLSLDRWRRTQEALGPFASQSEIDDCETRLARCEGRDGEIIERLGKLEKGQPRPGQMATLRGLLMRHEDRIAALEARALDGGDPLRRGPMPFRNDDMPTPDGFYRVIVDEIRALPWTTGQDGMFRCVSDEVWRARITPLLRRLDHEMTDGEGSDLADVVLGIGGGDPPRRNS